MNASDFTSIESGPYGLRWCYVYDGEYDSPPSVRQVEKILGVKLAPKTADASGERDDELAEEVYFAADDYVENAVATFAVQ